MCCLIHPKNPKEKMWYLRNHIAKNNVIYLGSVWDDCLLYENLYLSKYSSESSFQIQVDSNNLMAPWTRGFRKNLAKRLVTSSRSAARSENASIFVKHVTVLLPSNLCPAIFIFLPSAIETMLIKYAAVFQVQASCYEAKILAIASPLGTNLKIVVS